jgi:hypothetical protein
MAVSPFRECPFRYSRMAELPLREFSFWHSPMSDYAIHECALWHLRTGERTLDECLVLHLRTAESIFRECHTRYSASASIGKCKSPSGRCYTHWDGNLLTSVSLSTRTTYGTRNPWGQASDATNIWHMAVAICLAILLRRMQHIACRSEQSRRTQKQLVEVRNHHIFMILDRLRCVCVSIYSWRKL